jgi:hypothetical protein
MCCSLIIIYSSTERGPRKEAWAQKGLSFFYFCFIYILGPSGIPTLAILIIDVEDRFVW